MRERYRSFRSRRLSFSIPLGRPAALARDEVEERQKQQKSPGVEQEFPPPSSPLNSAASCFDLAVFRDLTGGSVFGRVAGLQSAIPTILAAIRIPRGHARQMFPQTAPVGTVKMIGLAFGTLHKFYNPLFYSEFYSEIGSSPRLAPVSGTTGNARNGRMPSRTSGEQADPGAFPESQPIRACASNGVPAVRFGPVYRQSPRLGQLDQLAHHN